jgi:hypothetical protein
MRRWNSLLWKLEGFEDLLFALFVARSSGFLLRRWQRPVGEQFTTPTLIEDSPQQPEG